MERLEELAILNEIGAKVASTLDLEAILAYVMQKVKEVFDVEACSLMLLDEKEWVLRFKVSFGKGAEEVKTLSFSADHGLAGWMVREKKPLLVLDAQNDPRFYQQIDHSTGLVTRDMIGVPLLVKERVIGVLEAINRLSGTFAEDDLRLLGFIGTPVAQSIENARLFDALNRAYADLLEHKRQIEESRNTLQTIFDGISDVLFIVDRELRIVAANVAASKFADVAADSLLGELCHAVCAGSAPSCTKECIVRRSFETGERAHGLYKVSAADGMHEWEVHTYPLCDENGQVIRVVIFERDVTEQRRLEASMARTAKLAAVGKLAAGAAHELSNPLTAILGNATLLQRLSSRDSSTYSLAGTILEAAERARNILRSLLDYSRQDQYAFAPIDINATLEWSLSLLKYAFNEYQIRLHKDLDAKLPLVIASESHLRTLWTNLLLNAVDAVKDMGKRKGGFKPKIEVSTALLEKEKAVRVKVRDNGIGIPDELLPKMFEPFFTTKKPSEGTGLGLYICHTIVEQHGGQIELQSTAGRGTEFTVKLPVSVGS